jgi:nitrate reductase NapAB chaperone NapD
MRHFSFEMALAAFALSMEGSLMNEHIEASDSSEVTAAARSKSNFNPGRFAAQTLERGRRTHKDDQTEANTEDKTADKTQEKTEGEIEDDLKRRIEDDKTNPIGEKLSNLVVLASGIIIPILIPALFVAVSHKRLVLLLLSRPLETLATIALCLAIPMTNLKLHRAICKNNFVFGIKPGIAAGLAIGTALSITAACLVGSSLSANNEALKYAQDSLILGNMWLISLLYLASAFTTLHLVLVIRKTKELDSARRRILAYLLMGASAAAAVLIGGELPTLVSHYYERQALSTNTKTSAPALSFLRKANCERQLRLLCADNRSAGFAGLLLPLKPIEAERLYFILEGKPFVIENKSEKSNLAPIETSYLNQTYYMNAEQLKNFAIGTKTPGLTLARSTINGNLHPDSLSATLVWTMVFQNDGPAPTSSRAELSLPDGAAVTGAKLWQDGEAIEGTFLASRNHTSQQFSYEGGVSELGRGKYLLQSPTLSPDSQVKMQVTMVMPMELEQLESAQIRLPQIVDSNFSLEGEHNLELLSDNTFENSYQAFTSGQREDGVKFLSGALTTEQVESSPLSILCKRHPVTNLASCKDIGVFKNYFRSSIPATQEQAADKARYGLSLIRQIEQTTANAPGRVVVVVDGSVETSKYLDQIKESLKHIPSGIPVSVLVASNDDQTISKPEDLKVALGKLDNVNFTGGQENLKTLVKAAEFAGHTKEGVVLWLHGRQPAFHKQIYIISPFAYKPALYEFAYDPAEAVDREYFKNHSELSTFTTVTRSGDQVADLGRFFRRWQAGRKEYSVVAKIGYSPLAQESPTPEAVQKEAKALMARSLSTQLIESSNRNPAATAALAARSGIVSLDSTILFDTSERQSLRTNLPSLAGATNGTLSPQGEEAIVISGVNTAGTVRVNNLANLEALINLIANFCEVTFVIVGGVSLLNAATIKSATTKLLGMMTLDRPGLVVAGTTLIIVGLAIPGVLNFLVASARDAALFN